jgi:glucose/arabinose dehydrogenase
MAGAGLSATGPAAVAGPAGDGAGVVGTAGTTPPRGAAPLNHLQISSSVVATGLTRPTAIVAPDDGSNRLFVTEKPGQVRAFTPGGGLAPTPLLDIRDRVNQSGNERGLLGIATSPQFGGSRALYVAYTALPDGALRLSRFRLDAADQHPIPADREEVLLSQPHAQFSNHNGGQLAFGPDGFLYWSLGDGGGGGDPLASGQNLGTLLGKVLRLDVGRACAPAAYCVPPDNPFVGRQGARPEIWMYGLRNPWRFSFDAADRSMWLADVGQNTFEEVNHVAGGAGGTNFGWSCREGPEQFNPDRCTPGATFAEPVFWYGTRVDGCAAIGGFAYRGARFAGIAGGTYVMTDYCSATAWGIRVVGGTHQTEVIGQLPAGVTAFGEDTARELYLVTDQTGELHQVSFAQPRNKNE